MCIRTVKGTYIDPESFRTVPGDIELSARTISGLGGGVSLAGTLPTVTEILGPASGTYTTPAGCVYIDVYVTGAGGGGSGGNSASVARRYGNGGGSGDVSFGVFQPGSYSYALHSGGAGGAGGSTSSSPGVTAAQFSTFSTLKASGGSGAAAPATALNTAAGKWNTDLSQKNTLLNFGYNAGIVGGNSPAVGGQSLFNARFGKAARDTVDNGGEAGIYGGGGGGGARAGDGGAGGSSVLLIIEYY
jgi:hypothetical protein